MECRCEPDTAAQLVRAGVRGRRLCPELLKFEKSKNLSDLPIVLRLFDRPNGVQVQVLPPEAKLLAQRIDKDQTFR